LSNELTADARYNLERLDQLGTVFPIGASATQTINSSADIRLNANSTTLGGDGNGTVFAPNLTLSNQLVFEAGAFELTIVPATQTESLVFTLPPDAGTTGQFLSTNGSGTLTWEDPPTSNFSSLNDTLFTNLQQNEIAQYDGSQWVNASIPNTRQTGIFDWLSVEGNTKTIVHNFNTQNIQVWIYEEDSDSIVWIQGVDYIDDDTILLTAKASPEFDYRVHLIQTV
jgi:hypothetical protein